MGGGCGDVMVRGNVGDVTICRDAGDVLSFWEVGDGCTKGVSFELFWDIGDVKAFWGVGDACVKGTGELASLRNVGEVMFICNFGNVCVNGSCEVAPIRRFGILMASFDTGDFKPCWKVESCDVVRTRRAAYACLLPAVIEYCRFKASLPLVVFLAACTMGMPAMSLLSTKPAIPSVVPGTS